MLLDNRNVRGRRAERSVLVTLGLMDTIIYKFTLTGTISAYFLKIDQLSLCYGTRNAADVAPQYSRNPAISALKRAQAGTINVGSQCSSSPDLR